MALGAAGRLAFVLLLSIGALRGECSRVAARHLTEIEPRIAAGQPAADGQFPYAAALFGNDILDASQFLTHYCGATLIEPNVLMTAAHCTDDGYGGLRKPTHVLVGMTNVWDPLAVKRYVTKIYRHPGYNENTLANDVALLQLNKKVGRRVTPVKLAGAGTSRSMPPLTKLTVFGFGRTEIKYLSKKLLYTTVNYVNFTDCQAYYNDDEFQVSDTTLCAGTAKSKANDACVGDSGSGLVDGNGVQVGIVSFGPDRCGGLGHVGGYTDVSALRPWINKTLQTIKQSIAKAQQG